MESMQSDVWNKIKTPCFLIYEDKVRSNLALIDEVRKKTGAEIVMAFKANAVWRLFPILKEYGFGFAASSMNELRLGFEELGTLGHTYCLAYHDSDMPRFMCMSSHITFNSLNQWEKHKSTVVQWNSTQGNHHVSPGLRINPHCSVIDTDIYNPALPGSRFGVSQENLDKLPTGIEGLHFHQLCESDSWDLEKVLTALEEGFGHLLPQIKWLNMGGGHLMTRKGYDTAHLIDLLKEFKTRYPRLQIILEPGSAFMWQTGDLITTVMDVVEDAGITTAIIDGSFTCHMPDTLEMPYKPVIAQAIDDDSQDGYIYNIGGNSCLSGDFKGSWKFQKPLEAGDIITFKDMNHYTTVKTTMFNGLQHPSLVLLTTEGEMKTLREYGFEDYKNRMS